MRLQRSRTRQSPRARNPLLGVAILTLSAAACEQLIGLDHPTVGEGTGGAGADEPGGGTGGNGGFGAGKVCEPGKKKACAYTGDPATKDVGPCRAAEQTCDADGTSYGPCEGEVLPALEVCHNDSDEDCDGTPCAMPLWSHLWGDAGDQTVTDLGITDTGEAVIVGEFSGTLDFENGPLISAAAAPYVASISGSGVPQGALSFMATTKVVLGAEGSLYGISGSAETTIQAFDSAWGATWAQSAASGMLINFNDVGTALDGDTLITGQVFSGVTMGTEMMTPNGGPDAFVAKLDATNGAVAFAKTFGSGGNQNGQKIRLAVGGDMLVAGRYTGPLLFAGDPSATGDIFLVRLTLNGDVLWGRGFFGDTYEYDVARDNLGGAVIAARFIGQASVETTTLQAAGGAGIFVVSMSAAGAVAWSRVFGGAGFEPLLDGRLSVAVDSKDNVVLTTRGLGYVDFGGGTLGKVGEQSEFLVKLSPEGEHIWSKRFGPVNDGGGCLVAVAPDDDIVLACSVDAENPDFGTGPLPSKGALDIVLARVAP